MLNVHSFEFSPIAENTYVLYNEHKHCIIIDPGCYYPEERETLFTWIESRQLVPKLLINTHCHLDHVFGNKDVAARYGLELHISQKEKILLEHAPVSGLMYNLPFDNYDGPLHFLDEKGTVSLDNDLLEIRYTPGHSPGSLSFYSKADGFVISGDALFQRSIGRTDLPGGNHGQLIESIKTQLLSLPPTTTVYSGHGPATTIGEEAGLNPFLK